jgi:hypothetical protein
MTDIGNQLAAGLRASRDWSGGSMDVEGFARLDLSDFAFVELTADRDKFEGYAGLMLRF